MNFKSQTDLMDAPFLRFRRKVRHYVDATAFVTLAMAFGFVLADVMDPAHVLLVFLGPVAMAAVRSGFGPAAWAASLSVLVTAYFFAAPIFSVAVADPGTIWALIVFVLVAAGTAFLADLARQQAESARIAEATVRRLFLYAEELAGIVGIDDLIDAAIKRIHEMFDGEIAIFMPNQSGELDIKKSQPRQCKFGPGDLEAAAWCLSKNEQTGGDLSRWPATNWRFLPLVAAHGVVGVLGARKPNAGGYLPTDDQVILGAAASLAAIAVERATMANRLDEARLIKETEDFRAAMLSSLTHDFRTPLASIVGSLSSLRHFGALYDDRTRDDMLDNAEHEAGRLNRYIDNLLEMTRLDTGTFRRNMEPLDVDDVIGTSLKKAEAALAPHVIKTVIEPNLPMIKLDFVLVEQAMHNLLDNAAKYAPSGSTITVKAGQSGGKVLIEIMDEGPGIPKQHLERVFDRFFRVKSGERGRSDTGLGLGLTIAKGYTEAMGGSLNAENRPSGGAKFVLAFQVESTPESTS